MRRQEAFIGEFLGHAFVRGREELRLRACYVERFRLEAGDPRVDGFRWRRPVSAYLPVSHEVER